MRLIGKSGRRAARARGAVAVLGTALLVLAGLASPTQAAPSTDPPRAGAVVETDKGLVQGEVLDRYRLFRGIPFAAPPVGPLRFQPPQEAAPWTGTRDATRPGEQCAQLVRLGNPETFGEDCLYLNVTTPRRSSTPAGSGRPVMVWFHGGAWVYGTGARYDASPLATIGDAVVVTVNYRLGPLGFMAHPALSGEQPEVGSGSYALEDQLAALRWVQRNAAAFGGDPGRVTVFGESAGASSVCAQIASPAAAGLFHRAITESYSCSQDYDTLPTAEAKGATVAAAVGCTDSATAAACLRSVSSEALLRAWPGGAFVVGGSKLPLQPGEALRTGRFNEVPMIMGNNRDEMRLYVPLNFSATLTAEQYPAALRTLYRDAADRVAARYPVGDYPSPAIALATAWSDSGSALSTCKHLEAYELAANGGRPVPVWAYQFRDRSAPPLIDVPGYEEGAEHGVELSYVFPGLLGELSPSQEVLSRRMIRYWTEFAHSGDPNGRRLPTWPRFDGSADVLGLAPGPGGIQPVDVAAESRCDFWASL